jgi:putative Holliday junction resolvase
MGTIAQPLPTIRRRRGKRPPYTALAQVIAEWEIEVVVVGLPLEASGEEGEMAKRVREFAEGLERRTQLPIVFWDERFSTARALRDLPKLGLPAAARRDKDRIDAMAAALILQTYLDAQPTP